MPVTAVVAATASLKDPNLVPERRRINATIRQQTFDWLSPQWLLFYSFRVELLHSTPNVVARKSAMPWQKRTC
jgi:hypothetical protein